MAAMQLGKHVYVEKPMAHDIHETRVLVEAARRCKVVTQMGNQGHSMRGVYQLKEWLDQGVIGNVTEVQCWTNRPSWPQGIDRPADTPPVPDTLDWDLWLGPAPQRPYHGVYCPRNWRGWWDFGEGALGDMGCHILDPAFYALELGAPARLSAETSGVNDETAPKSSIIRYEFPARGSKPPVTLTWYDGGNMPPRPEEAEEGERLGDNDGGSLFIGEKGKIAVGTYGMGLKLLPKALAEQTERPKIERERTKGHQLDWVEACKTGGPTVSNFDYAGPLTEVALLGIIAMRASGPIEWDAANMTFPNEPEADRFLRRDFREGWTL